MKTLIKSLYNICLSLSIAFSIFSIFLVYRGVTLIASASKCTYERMLVKMDSHEPSSLGSGGNFDYTVGYYGSKKIKVDFALPLDTTYLVWNCEGDSISYIVNSINETPEQFKLHKIFGHVKFIAIILFIITFLWGVSIYLGRLMEKYKISNNEN